MGTTYAPTSRRPIANIFRRTAQATVAWCVGHGISPNAISYGSIVAAIGAAMMFIASARWTWMLLLAPLLCYVRLWLNMLDGMVAVAGGKASKKGEIVNDLPDRASDILIFAGLAHSGWVIQGLGYWTALMAVMTAYVGLTGQAVGVQREYSGVMSKPWRMVCLHVGAWATWVLIQTGVAIRVGALSVLDWTCIIIIAGCAQTIVIRLVRIVRALDLKGQ